MMDQVSILHKNSLQLMKICLAQVVSWMYYVWKGVETGFLNDFIKLAFVSNCDADDLITSLELKSFVFQSSFLANGYSAMLLPRNIIRSEMTC